MRCFVGLVSCGLLACGAKTELSAGRSLGDDPVLQLGEADAGDRAPNGRKADAAPASPNAPASADAPALPDAPVIPRAPEAPPIVASSPISTADAPLAPLPPVTAPPQPPIHPTATPSASNPPSATTPSVATSSPAVSSTPTVSGPAPSSEPPAPDPPASPPAPDPPASEPIESPRPDEPATWGSALPDPQTSTSAPFTACASVEWLGGDLFVRAVSADGSTLIGNAGPHTRLGAPSGPAFRWRRGEPIEWLGLDLEADVELQLADVTSDGSWIAATLFTAGDQRRSDAVRIDPDGNVEELATDGEAVAISADGNVVVGAAATTPGEEPEAALERTAFQWHAATGLETLPLFPFRDELEAWRPSDMSADGSIIMGSGGVLFASYCVTYVAGVGIDGPCMAGLPALSADGSLAVNRANSGRYASGLQALALPTGEQLDLEFPSPSSPGSPSSLATAVNSDGSIVFGVAEAVDDTLSTRAYVWRRDVGTVPFTQLLEDSCVDTTQIPHAEWSVTSISGDSHLVTACALLDEEGHCFVAAWQ